MWNGLMISLLPDRNVPECDATRTRLHEGELKGTVCVLARVIDWVTSLLWLR